MTEVAREDLPNFFQAVADIMGQHAEELCQMDALMGDGDLGLTMKKGFGKLPQIIREIEETDIGKTLMKAGMRMSSIVPSTMGTLMSSGIMSGGKAIVGCEAIDGEYFSLYLSGFCEGIKKRGKCQEGDRTVLDVLQPAAVSAKIAADQGKNLEETAFAAVEGGRLGLEKTKALIPKFGKAAVFKERAKDLVDQGAYAGELMLEGHYAFVKE